MDKDAESALLLAYRQNSLALPSTHRELPQKPSGAYQHLRPGVKLHGALHRRSVARMSL
jgi:hypothetical protein